jgi:hypothetical protein
MARWVRCGAQFVTGDVVAWGEKVWTERGTGRRKKPALAGTRIVTAQVEAIGPTGLVALSVLDCRIVSSEWELLKPLRRGEGIRRKRETIEKGGAHRRVGGDEEESARAIASSVFFRAEAPTAPAVRPRAPARSREVRGRPYARRVKGPRPRPRGRG